MIKDQKTIVFIVCLGHSGSTLLGNILGSHSKGLHLGEIVAPLKKGRPLICRNCFDTPCPIWGNLLQKDFVKKVYKDYLNTQSNNYFKNLFSSNYSSKIYSKLFDKYPHLKFIIDSSKVLDWYDYNSKDHSFNYKYIFLYRNIKAVYASLKRSYKTSIQEGVPQLFDKLEKIFSLYKALSNEQKIVIQYENFTNNPKAELDKLCLFLGIEYENNFYHFNEFEHHLIGGNQGLLIQQDEQKIKKLNNLISYTTPEETVAFYKGLKGIIEDKRWEKELTEKEKEFIDNKVERLKLPSQFF